MCELERGSTCRTLEHFYKTRRSGSRGRKQIGRSERPISILKMLEGIVGCQSHRMQRSYQMSPIPNDAFESHRERLSTDRLLS